VQTLRRKQAIVNADDLGFSTQVTEGILRAHSDGIVTSTTICANMPAAAQAVRRLADFPELGVGVHLNASQGPCLSAEGRALAGDDGQMNSTAIGVILACIRRPGLIKAVRAEWDAQIRWVLDHGIRPTHLDSHRHTHAFAPARKVAIDLAGRYGIRFVRRHCEVLPGGHWPAVPMRAQAVSRLLTVLGRADSPAEPTAHATRGTWGIAHTGRITVPWLVKAAGKLRPGVTEILTHPGCSGDDLDPSMTRLLESRKAELAALCDPAVKDAFTRNAVELIHYGKLR